jgi:hypothetical protein
MKRMALAQTLDGKCRSTPNAISADGKVGIFRTSRKKPAGRRQKGRDYFLV